MREDKWSRSISATFKEMKLIHGATRELAVAVGVGLRFAVMEDTALILAVFVVDGCLLCAHRTNSHEHNEHGHADECHQNQIPDGFHVSSLSKLVRKCIDGRWRSPSRCTRSADRRPAHPCRCLFIADSAP
jgi:hypothetical protein